MLNFGIRAQVIFALVCVLQNVISVLVSSAHIIAIVLTITNALAFSRCDKFGKASELSSSVMGNASNMLTSRLLNFWTRS